MINQKKKKSDLYLQFVDIDRYADAQERYNVISIEGMRHKLGRSEEGFPKFFVNTGNPSSGIHNIMGELLSVEYNVDCCLVDSDGKSLESTFAIITLRSQDEALQQLFIEVFTLMLKTLKEVPENYELSLKIEGLLSIFSALKRKPIHKIQGLWAELLLIDLSKSPEVVAKAWHNSAGAKYDFTMGCDKIEVKSTSSEDRVHSFSLDQLNPSSSSNLLIASVVVRESAEDENGLSVIDLYKKICSRVKDTEARIHLYNVILNTLGDEYDKSINVFFDYSQGKDSLEFYDYRDVPKIKKEDVPQLVTGVKFSSNLSHLESAFKKNYDYLNNNLFQAI